MRVLVTGSREYNRWQKVHALLDSLHSQYGITKIVQGCAQGADYAAWSWANLNGIQTTGDEYKPDWDNLGKSAGPKRNECMHDEESPHLVVGFPGDRGTEHMLGYAVRQGTPTLVIPDPEWSASRLDASDIIEIDVDGDDDEDAPKTEPYWLLKPTKKNKWHRRVVTRQTPVDRYAADTMF